MFLTHGKNNSRKEDVFCFGNPSFEIKRAKVFGILVDAKLVTCEEKKYMKAFIDDGRKIFFFATLFFHCSIFCS